MKLSDLLEAKAKVTDADVEAWKQFVRDHHITNIEVKSSRRTIFSGEKLDGAILKTFPDANIVDIVADGKIWDVQNYELISKIAPAAKELMIYYSFLKNGLATMTEDSIRSIPKTFTRIQFLGYNIKSLAAVPAHVKQIVLSDCDLDSAAGINKDVNLSLHSTSVGAGLVSLLNLRDFSRFGLRSGERSSKENEAFRLFYKARGDKLDKAEFTELLHDKDLEDFL